MNGKKCNRKIQAPSNRTDGGTNVWKFGIEQPLKQSPRRADADADGFKESDGHRSAVLADLSVKESRSV